MRDSRAFVTIEQGDGEVKVRAGTANDVYLKQLAY